MGRRKMFNDTVRSRVVSAMRGSAPHVIFLPRTQCFGETRVASNLTPLLECGTRIADLGSTERHLALASLSCNWAGDARRFTLPSKGRHREGKWPAGFMGVCFPMGIGTQDAAGCYFPIV